MNFQPIRSIVDKFYEVISSSTGGDEAETSKSSHAVTGDSTQDKTTEVASRTLGQTQTIAELTFEKAEEDLATFKPENERQRKIKADLELILDQIKKDIYHGAYTLEEMRVTVTFNVESVELPLIEKIQENVKELGVKFRSLYAEDGQGVVILSWKQLVELKNFDWVSGIELVTVFRLAKV